MNEHHLLDEVVHPVPGPRDTLAPGRDRARAAHPRRWRTGRPWRSTGCAGRSPGVVRALDRVRARRPGRAEPPALRRPSPSWRAPGSATISRRCARTAAGAGVALDADAGRPPLRGGGAAAAHQPAVRRDAAPLRPHRPRRPADDAPDRVDAGVPRLVAGCRRPRAVAAAAARLVRSWPRPSLAAAARAPGSRPGSTSTRAGRRSTTGCCAATTRSRRTPTSPRAPRVFAMPGGDPAEPTSFAAWAGPTTWTPPPSRHHLSTLFPPVRPRGPLPGGALPRRAARRARHPDRRRCSAGCCTTTRPVARPCASCSTTTPGSSTTGRRPPWRRSALADRATRPRALAGIRTRPATWSVWHEQPLFVIDPLEGLDAAIDSSVGLMAATADSGRGGVGVRTGGPRARGRSAPGPGSPDRAAAADPPRRPPLAGRHSLVRRARDAGDRRRRRGPGRAAAAGPAGRPALPAHDVPARRRGRRRRARGQPAERRARDAGEALGAALPRPAAPTPW